MIKPLLPETEGKVARFEIVFYCRLISFCSFVSLCEDNSLWALWALRFIFFRASRSHLKQNGCALAHLCFDSYML